ncbi:hypothetical protein B9G55_22800 [Saccharibacillus sp. O16]|nr:hypothetical protein B9G55_22800 [Saccharibacillus sp. O16]
MNPYLSSAFHQIRLAIDSVIEMLHALPEAEWNAKPVPGKRSYLELVSHLSLICKADLLILNGASLPEMEAYYENNKPQTLQELKENLTANYNELVKEFSGYSEDELFEVKESYWGVKYTRYEWLLEILGHLYHHRSQFHTYLSMDLKEVKVQLFE